MKPRTQDELLAFFMDGGCMLDKDERTVYISDVNADGKFFGIMVADELPPEECGDVVNACQYALDCIPAPGAFGAKNRMRLIEAPGAWFDELCDEYFANEGKFVLSEPEHVMDAELEFSLKSEAYQQAYSRFFQYIVNELEGRDGMTWRSPFEIATEYVDMKLTGTTLIPAMNGIDDAIEKLYQLAKPENVHSVRVR